MHSERPAPSYDVVRVVSEADSEQVFGLYDAVFADQPDYRAWRDQVWDRHTSRDGFRLARAVEAGRLVGFAYGYTGRHGQWWPHQAALVLEPPVAQEWLGGHFELVSIAVAPSSRGAGIGEGLLRRVVEGLHEQRCLLMTTADADDPARRLYAAQGWEVVGPGLRDGQVIMGRHSP